MAIKPVTFAGAANLSANLYALEVRARFRDRSAADGYYTDYGDELTASAVGNIITVGRGAFLVQGRLCEITEAELVTVEIQNGYVGYLCARIDTYRESDADHCVLTVKTAPTLAAVTLTREDTYARIGETESRVYELPLYSFAIESGAVTSLTRIIRPITAETRDAWFRHHLSFGAMRYEGEGTDYAEYCVFCDVLSPDATPVRDEEGLRALLAEVGECCCTGYLRRYTDALRIERATLYKLACNLMKDQIGPAENTGTVRLYLLCEDADGNIRTQQTDLLRDDGWIVTVTDSVS